MCRAQDSCSKVTTAFLLHDLMIAFVKPSAMIYKSTLDVQFEVGHNIKQNSDLAFGEEAQAFRAEKAANLCDTWVEEFYSAVKAFYRTSCMYIVDKFSMSCELLQHAEVMDVSKPTEVRSASVEFFLKRSLVFSLRPPKMN